MLATLILPLLPLAWASTKIITASDPSLELSTGDWNEAESASGSSFLFTDTSNAYMTATLPDAASSVAFVGYRRSGSSTYGYCLDCDGASKYTLNTADGSGNDEEEESTIFSMDLDPSSQHTLTVYNLANNGEITFGHLAVEIDDVAPVLSASDTPSPPTTASISTDSISATSVKPTSTSSRSTSSSTGSSQPSTTPPSNTVLLPGLAPSSTANEASASSGVSGKPLRLSTSLIAVIAVLTFTFVLSVVVGLFFLLRTRRRRRQSRGSSAARFSSADSIIPIMPPPLSPPPMQSLAPVRPASPRPSNPFAPPDLPLPPLPLDAPMNSSMMQRRMENSSPASSFSQPQLWIARTPIRSGFAV
ncbi:hypothetical protein C8J57DRAFT_1268704 [Mycena rebaudengoi]|nr:hypothetical protein C8J57DRAFT_1268704 [Mycena rebaudengoi]